MTTKSTVEKKEDVPRFEQGDLVIDKDRMLVVSVSSNGSDHFAGQVVGQGCSIHPLGEHINNWVQKDFVPFHGKIILESE